MNAYGSIRINLKKLIQEREISKSKLCHRAELQRTQLNRYCNNTVTRLDTNVLARLCAGLECEIADLLEFIPSNESNI